MSAVALILLFVQGLQGTVGEAVDGRSHLPVVSPRSAPACADNHLWSDRAGRCCPVCPWGTGALEPCAVIFDPAEVDDDDEQDDNDRGANVAGRDSNTASTTTTAASTTSARDSTTTTSIGSATLGIVRQEQAVVVIAVPAGCRVCQSGASFSSNHSHQEPCRPCSACPKNARPLEACNATHDTRCACEEGFFLSAETGRCVLCDLCPVGWGASTACGGGTNTACRKCVNGTYSDVLNATAPCRRCTVCGEGQRMLQMCTATQDTICLRKYMDIPPSYRYDIDGKDYQGLDRFYPGHDDDGDSSSDDHLPAQHGEEEGGIDVIPLYCAALGAVVVGLLAYVALVHYRRMRDKRLAREPHEDVEYSKASCADSGIYVDNDHHHHQKKTYHSVVITSSTRLRDLPETKKKEMEKTYVAGSRRPHDWKRLARELGYNSGKICSFESRGSRDPGAPFRHVIHDWSRLEGATVGAFLKALRNTGRPDVVKFLQTEFTEPLQPLTCGLPQHVV